MSLVDNCRLFSRLSLERNREHSFNKLQKHTDFTGLEKLIANYYSSPPAALSHLSLYKRSSNGDNVSCAPSNHCNLSLCKTWNRTPASCGYWETRAVRRTDYIFAYTHVKKETNKTWPLWSQRAELLWSLFTRGAGNWEDWLFRCSSHNLFVSSSPFLCVCVTSDGSVT